MTAIQFLSYLQRAHRSYIHYVLCAIVYSYFSSLAMAQSGVEYETPPFGQFPSPSAGRLLAGELVAIDHVNRRGAIRLDGDGSEETYHHSPAHQFALLPYGEVWFHGAPAELRDIPIGTHLHGRFLLPPITDLAISPPPAEHEKYVPKETHALILEDDFTYYERLGVSWQIEAVDRQKGLITLAQSSQNKAGKVYTFDMATRVWRGRTVGNIDDLTRGQMFSCGMTWAPDWKNGQMQLADVWLDSESKSLATELQLRQHLRHERFRWLPGWIDHVDHDPSGSGVVTLTLFGGKHSSLYDDIRKAKYFEVAASDPTLRTWWHNHDKKGGDLVELIEYPTPPPGSSGIQLRLKCPELLAGYRPGAVVRVRPPEWPNFTLPPEERIKRLDDR